MLWSNIYEQAYNTLDYTKRIALYIVNTMDVWLDRRYKIFDLLILPQNVRHVYDVSYQSTRVDKKSDVLQCR